MLMLIADPDAGADADADSDGVAVSTVFSHSPFIAAFSSLSETGF
jgi:hypothetical protein